MPYRTDQQEGLIAETVMIAGHNGDQIRAFFAEHPVPPAARALEQAIERIEACVDLNARQSPAFARWLGAVTAP